MNMQNFKENTELIFTFSPDHDHFLNFPAKRNHTKCLLVLTSQDPLQNSERDPQEKLGILVIWEDP